MIEYDLENVKSSKQRANTVNGNMGNSDSVPYFDLRLRLEGLIQAPVLVFVMSKKQALILIAQPDHTLMVYFRSLI